MNASHFPQIVCVAAGGGLAVLALLLAVFPVKDHPEPERCLARPDWTGDELAAIRDHIDAGREARDNDHQGRHRRAA